MGLNQAQDKVFCHFLDFGSLVFLEIAYSDSLQQCPTFSKGKTHKKMFGAQIRVRRAKIVAKINFFWYFLTFGSLVFLEIAYNDSMEQFLETNRGKIYEQKLGSPNLDQTGQNQVFCHFLKFGSLVFLEIAKNDSWEHFLTTSRGKTHEKLLF